MGVMGELELRPAVMVVEPCGRHLKDWVSDVNHVKEFLFHDA